jgi:hypothetical protein
MTSRTLQERVTALEATVAQLLAPSALGHTKPDGRSTLGMFADDPVMREIDEEGRRIRKADRQKARA